ncbi:MAG: hypothetical protein EPO30_11690 [Lysobacteraceae bacterium]|nr:MAG: hypothetical protein EPO30_11690 [Xanthomonadaceae bacterium]
MAAVFLFLLLALFTIGGVVALVYQAAIGSATAATALGVATAGLVTMFISGVVLLLFLAAGAALFCSRARGHWRERRSRMFEDWHRAAHDQPAAGKGEI